MIVLVAELTAELAAEILLLTVELIVFRERKPWSLRLTMRNLPRW